MIMRPTELMYELTAALSLRDFDEKKFADEKINKKIQRKGSDLTPRIRLREGDRQQLIKIALFCLEPSTLIYTNGPSSLSSY